MVQTQQDNPHDDPDRGLASDLAGVTAQIPAPIRERIDRAVEAVTSSGAAPGLSVGEQAPPFTLPDALGRPVALADRLAAGPVVVVFYRGDWCPYCNLHLRALQAILPDLRARGASLVAIGPQAPDRALSLTEKAGLEFDVLSDVTQQVILDFRVRFTVPQDLQDVHRDIFQLDVSARNADGSWNLPIPATFVIAADGTVIGADVHADYRRRLEPATILALLDRTAG